MGRIEPFQGLWLGVGNMEAQKGEIVPGGHEIQIRQIAGAVEKFVINNNIHCLPYYWGVDSNL